MSWSFWMFLGTLWRSLMSATFKWKPKNRKVIPQKRLGPDCLMQAKPFTFCCWPLMLMLSGTKKKLKKEWECPDFLPNVSRLLCACVYMVKWRPMLCLWTATVAGRIFQPRVIFRMHTCVSAHLQTRTYKHTRTRENCPLQVHLLFYQQCADMRSCKTMGHCSCF